MSTAENIAIERRVADIEARLAIVEPVRIITTLAVYRRGPERVCRTVDDVFEFARLDPVTEHVVDLPDLDVLIDAESGTHLERDGDDPEYLELCEGVRTIEVKISCHEHQVEPILSDAPVTATTGGARAGKTRIVAWWLFRQWLLRGHGVSDEEPKPALFWWIREDSEKLYEHAIQWILALWPPDVIVGIIPGPTTKHPKLTLIDQSTLAFRHAHHSGGRAGTNLRSANVEATVVDELSAILNKENWLEIQNRHNSTGGRIACAYTPTNGHWCEELIEGAAPMSGGAIKLYSVHMFQNPWWSLPRAWEALLRDGSLTASSLATVLEADDQPAAAMEAVQDPDSRRRHFGISAPVGIVLWREWHKEQFTVRGPARLRSTWDHRGEQLRNITAVVVGEFHGRAGRDITVAGGVDFNVAPGVVVVFQIFGTLDHPLVYVHDEIATFGPTIKSAQAVSGRYPGLCLHCDPVGAMDGRHASHGARSMTDAEELRMAGLYVEPANGYDGPRVSHLPQLDSINAMHRAMSLGLLRVHERCVGVLKALRDMRAKPDGTIKKTSGVRSESDRTSAYGDALRYGVWPVWRDMYTTGDAVMAWD